LKSLIEELKYSFKRKDNGLIKIILINIIIFVVVGVIFVFSHMTGYMTVLNFIQENQHLPAKFSTFMYRPWTLVTYFFSHDIQNIFHIVFNMLFLYWFGNLIVEYLGNRRLVNLYILGGIFGGIFYLLLYNLVPFFVQNNMLLLIGSSGAVYAVVVAAATLLPDYTFYLIFLGPVKIKYIAAFYLFISFLGSVGANAGGNICHLGGALIGYIFIAQLKRGNDLGKPLSKTKDFIGNIIEKKPAMKVSYINKGKEIKPDFPDQKEIDAILDKINRSGYESLSKEEKQKLFKASQK
jgi:membrane associated rhomboid family serine protease